MRGFQATVNASLLLLVEFSPANLDILVSITTAYREHSHVASSMSCSNFNFNSTSFSPTFPGYPRLVWRSDGDGLMLYALHMRVTWSTPFFFPATIPSLLKKYYYLANSLAANLDIYAPRTD